MFSLFKRMSLESISKSSNPFKFIQIHYFLPILEKKLNEPSIVLMSSSYVSKRKKKEKEKRDENSSKKNQRRNLKLEFIDYNFWLKANSQIHQNAVKSPARTWFNLPLNLWSTLQGYLYWSMFMNERRTCLIQT